MFRNLSVTVAVAVLGGVFAPSAAKADFTLTIDSTTIDFTALYTANQSNGTAVGLVDGLVYVINQGGTNVATLTGTIDGFSITFSASTTSPDGNPGQVTNESINVSSNGAAAGANISFILTSTGFLGIPPDTGVIVTNTLVSSSFEGTTSAITGSTDVTPATGSDPTLATLTGASSASSSSDMTLTGTPYTISNTATIYGLGGDASNDIDQFSLTSTVEMAPAPSGLILVATMVPFFGLLSRRLRQIKPEMAA
jgi:hypothetical protein